MSFLAIEWNPSIGIDLGFFCNSLVQFNVRYCFLIGAAFYEENI